MDLRDDLEQTLGLTFSNDWYRECAAALQQPQQRTVVTSDMILEQVLYHDLRDVVRDDNQNTMIQTISSSSSTVSVYAQILRNAVVKSLQPSSGTSSSSSSSSKTTLPSNFRCCLQMEEICDVTKNAESRLTTPPSTFVSSSSSSCHKLCLIDGYLPALALVAIEVAPIIVVGVATGTTVPKLLPGTKLLLFGSIIVRNGIIGLHNGNCIILGGYVERLIRIQQKAIEHAQQLSGHGIDPTIRALIWNKQNDHIMENDENGDEGEHESSDVPHATVPQHLVQQQPSIIVTASHQPLQIRPQQDVIQRRSYPSMVATTPASSQNHPCDIRANPDKHGTTSGRTVTCSSNSVVDLVSNIQSSHTPTMPAVVQNRYATVPRVPLTSTINNTITAASQLTRLGSPNDVIFPTIIPNTTSTSQDTMMTFTQFHDFLKRILQNEQEYSDAMTAVYTIGPMQQIGLKVYFNIEKANKRHKQWHDTNAAPSDISLSASSESKQHDFVMIAKFGVGENTHSQDRVTCRISSTILEPHFSVSATDLRKLSKVDKPKSESMVRDGGKMAQQFLYQLQKYEVSLDRNVDEVFHSTGSKPQLDGEHPFLFLKKVV